MGTKISENFLGMGTFFLDFFHVEGFLWAGKLGGKVKIPFEHGVSVSCSIVLLKLQYLQSLSKIGRTIVEYILP